MRKTRFFYGKKALLFILLVWLALLNEAAGLCLRETEKEKKTEEIPEKVTEAPRKEPEAAETDPEDQDPCIRVLISDTEQTSCYHPYITLIHEGKERTYTPESQELSQGDLILDGGEEGIAVTSVSRQESPPVYAGKLRIEKREEGLLLVNILPVEEYLKGVVPGEMPASYAFEALKAQAVCARTYAWKHMEENSLREYGADVDDSVNFQVYQNIAPRESTDRAVEETAGEVITQDGELIEAYYFSTSAGATSTDEVWGAREAASYLQSVPCAFDAGETWSQWSVNIPWERLQSQAKEYTGSSGALTGLEILKKNQSGAVIELRAVTETGSFTISEEYRIRSFLSPEGCTIYGYDGSGTEGGKLLPSAYFSMETDPEGTVKIRGRGYGHGVGMSQNAARVMAEQGYTYREILNYFYKDVRIGPRKGTA